MTKIILLLISFLLPLSLFSNSDVSLQLSWKHQFKFAGYYMAKEKGFYSELGLNVNIKEFDSSVNITDDVVNNKTDFGIGYSSLIYDRYKNKPVVMLASILQHSPIVLLTKKRNDIKTIEDLRNKKLMLPENHLSMVSINVMLQSHQITPQMYTRQEQTFKIEDLIDGKTDAMFAYISNESYVLQEKNIPYTTFSPRDYGFDFYSDILFTSESLLEQSPKVVANFRAASLKGWKYAIEHKEETVKLILKKYNTQSKTRDALLYEANTITKLVDKDKVELGKIDPKRIEYISQIYSLIGLIKKSKTINSLIYNVEELRTENSLDLTNEEKEWIKTNTVKVGGETDWLPFDFVHDGKYQGISKDFVDVISKKTGLKIEYVVGQDWAGLVNDFKSGAIDVLPALYHTDERENFTEFTKPYFKIKDYVFARSEDNSIESIDDLKGKKIAVVDGYSSIKHLEVKFPNINFIKVNSMNEGIDAVLLKKADVYIDSYPAMTYTLSAAMQTGIKPVLPLNFYSNNLHIGINKSKQILASIFKKGLSAISKKERTKIINNWFIQADQKESIQKIRLSEAEKEWIATHKVKVGVEPWEPVIFMNKKNEISGISGDFTTKVIENTGLKVEYISKDWNVLLQEFKDKKLDILPDVYKTAERETFGLFGSAYFKMKDYLYVKVKNEDIKSMNDLNGRVLAIQDGNGNIDNIKKMFPDVKILLTSGAADSVQRVLKGQADALYAGQVIVETIIKNELISGLKGIRQVAFKAPTLHFMSKIDEPILQSILQKGLDQISYKERQDVISKWVSASDTIKFDEEELRYLAQDNVVKFVFDPDWKPMEWINDLGEHVGIISDLIKLMEQKSELNLEPLISQSWDTAIEKVKSGEASMFSGLGETKDRSEYLNFTQKSLFSTPFVIVSRKSDEFKNGFDSIDNRKIGIHSNSTAYGILKKERPELNFIVLNPDVDMFNKLRDKRIDGFVVNAAMANYYLKYLHYDDLHIAYKTKYTLDLKIAVTKNTSPELLSILNKTIDSISEKEISDIVYKWTEANATTSWKDYWIEILEVSSVVVLIILFILWNNRKLKFMVAEKTVELRELLDSLEIKVEERTADLNNAKKEVEAIHKHTRESIEYASLIQGALIPEDTMLSSYFKDYFVHWIPKDTVGGDIWLFDDLRHEDECLLFFIDCTGHGVPGAFVTMIVKAVEREIVANLKKHSEFDISPAIIMAHFNKTMKELLKQETKDSKSNAGWDGGIIYYNKSTQILKFAGAETPLFYIDVDGEFKTIKGNRYSVGYKKCAMDYEYKETILEVKEGMKFYCTTDGYLDQNGGEKGFPFGKKRFGNIVKEHHAKPMHELQDIFINEMTQYESMVEDNDRNDDITVISFEIGAQSESNDDQIEEIVKYEGMMAQNVIATAMDNIENKITEMSTMGTISTITIELCQNMMNYSKNEDIESRQILPAGEIEVQFVNKKYYSITSRNILSIEDKEKIEPKLIEIHSLDKAGIKKRYRELRKSGKNTHGKGGGIGIYEIAKVSDSMEYEFVSINEDKYYFTMKSTVKIKERRGEDRRHEG